MTEVKTPVNLSGPGTIAPLGNVMRFATLVERVVGRAAGLPGMATFHGFSGYGKSFSAIYASNRYRAYHVQCKSVWTRKHFLGAVLHEMGITPERNMAAMVEQIGQELAQSNRPLIVDEADYLADKGHIDVVRDIYESSYAAIVLIGEEALPRKLSRYERFHGRMLEWVAAQPADDDDAAHLARLYCPAVTIDADLFDRLRTAAAGSVRRWCVNLDLVREYAMVRGLCQVGLADYQGEIYTGTPPSRRG